MPRIMITVTDEMDADLKELAEQRGASVAGLVRLFVSQGLVNELGKEPDAYKVERGGYREHGDKSASGED